MLFFLLLAILGLRSGHADQLGEHDSGEDSFYAADVRGHGAWCHRDGRQRASGFPAEESPRPPADRLSWSLQIAQDHTVERERERCSQRMLQMFICFAENNKNNYLFIVIICPVFIVQLLYCVE